MADPMNIAIACALWDDGYADIPNIRKGECSTCQTAIVISRSSDLVIGDTPGASILPYCNRCTAEGIVAGLFSTS